MALLKSLATLPFRATHSPSLVASATELTTSYENVTIKCDVSFSELLKSKSKLAEYDVLTQPGAAQYAINAVLELCGRGEAAFWSSSRCSLSFDAGGCDK